MIDTKIKCPSCSKEGMSVFYEQNHVPVHSCLLMPNLDTAKQYPKGNIRLGFCNACGFISNVAFDPSVHEYSSNYEETQGFSPRFNAFAKTLCLDLIKRYDLRGKDVLEIGCGKGEFLVLLCELGNNRGIGIDPSYIPERTKTDADVTFITDFYSEKYTHLKADFVCCRHTLEHIQPTYEFVRMVRQAIGNRPDTIVFFELPDVSRVLTELAFWDIYYEHCSYFTLGSLSRLFRSCHFDVLHLSKAFDDQYLLIETRPTNAPTTPVLPEENDLLELKRNVQFFENNCTAKKHTWKEMLLDIVKNGKRPVIWGSGSKCVAFLTDLNVQNEVEYVVDINPFKHGRHLPITGHQIVAPEFLKSYQPDVIIVMNPIYCEEIQKDLDKMGVCAKMIAL